MTAGRKPILLAEDEETDALIFQLAMQKAGVDYPVTVARDGQEAIHYLNGDSPFVDRVRHPLPALVILDLKMPRMTGFEVLSWISHRPELGRIPAVILSSSSYHEDIESAKSLGAADYFVKPHSIQDLVEIIQAICQRWLHAAPVQEG